MVQLRNSPLLGHHTYRKAFILEWLVYAQRNMALVRLGWRTSYESPLPFSCLLLAGLYLIGNHIILHVGEATQI